MGTGEIVEVQPIDNKSCIVTTEPVGNKSGFSNIAEKMKARTSVMQKYSHLEGMGARLQLYKQFH